MTSWSFPFLAAKSWPPFIVAPRFYCRRRRPKGLAFLSSRRWPADARLSQAISRFFAKLEGMRRPSVPWEKLSNGRKLSRGCFMKNRWVQMRGAFGTWLLAGMPGGLTGNRQPIRLSTFTNEYPATDSRTVRISFTAWEALQKYEDIDHRRSRVYRLECSGSLSYGGS